MVTVYHVSLFGMLLNPGFKITTRFANLAKTAASTGKLIYHEMLQVVRNRVFIWY